MSSPTFTRRRLLHGAGALTTAGIVAGHGWPGFGATLDQIKADGVLRIGCEAAYVPFTYRDTSGSIVGFDIDLLERFVEPLGVRAEFIDTQWSGVIPALYAGRFEMIPGMSYTKERLERVLFSIPYADASQALLIRADDADEIDTIDGMSGKILGIKLGSPGETLKDVLDERLTAARGAGFSEVKIYDDHPAAYLALGQGSVDGVLNTVPTLSVVLRDRPGMFAMVEGVGGDNWHGFAFRQESVELKAFIDERITALKESGELEELQEKWFGFTMRLADEIPIFS